MDDRTLTAYLLIAGMIAAVVIWAALNAYNTRDRKIARRRARESAARFKRD
ncbi:hypothetical protein ACWPM1_07620 [Tsuneonella sp. HG249]